MGKRIKKILQKTRNYMYHKAHKKRAMEILKSLETEKGKTNPRFIRLSKEYAKDVFGSEKYAPWLFTYSAMAGEFKEGWIVI